MVRGRPRRQASPPPWPDRAGLPLGHRSHEPRLEEVGSGRPAKGVSPWRRTHGVETDSSKRQAGRDLENCERAKPPKITRPPNAALCCRPATRLSYEADHGVPTGQGANRVLGAVSMSAWFGDDPDDKPRRSHGRIEHVNCWDTVAASQGQQRLDPSSAAKGISPWRRTMMSRRPPASATPDAT